MTIALIGPPSAGKSTVGALVAQRLQVPFLDADAECALHYAEVGWSVERLLARADEVGYEAAHAEWEDALAHAVDALAARAGPAVVAFGAGHSHPTRPGPFATVAAALAPVEHVILLRPSPDTQESVRVLRQRCIASKGRDWVVDGVDWLQRWCGDGRDEQLATLTLWTGDEVPERTADRVVKVVSAVL